MHLRVEMPPMIFKTRGMMDVRVARKVAALSGLADPSATSDDAGRGSAWYGDYRELTTNELALGGPLRAGRFERAGVEDTGVFSKERGSGRKYHVAGPVDVAPIPNVVLQRYGPDTKAAFVLSGANTILAPVSAAVTAALEDVRRQVDDARLLLAVGQCLVQEVFQAQPILLLNAIQASRIQRAFGLSSLVVSAQLPDRPLRLARVEHGWHPDDAEVQQPTELAVTRLVWDSIVAPRSAFDESALPAGPVDDPYLRPRPFGEFEQDDALGSTGVPEAREQLVATLVQLSESLLVGSLARAPHDRVVLVPEQDGTRTQEVIIARQRQVELMISNIGPHLEPIQVSPHPGVPPRVPAPGSPLRLPIIDVDVWRDTPLLQRRAVLLAHLYALRAGNWLAGVDWIDRGRDRELTAQRFAELAVAAVELLGPDDPLSEEILLRSLSYRVARAAQLAEAQRSEVDELLRRLDTLIERGRRQDRPGRARLLALLHVTLGDLSWVRRAADAGLTAALPTVPELTSVLRAGWAAANVLADQLITEPVEHDANMNYYAAFLVGSRSEPDDILAGLALLSRTVIPAGKELARRDGRWRVLRTAYESYCRGLAAAVKDKLGDDDQVRRWAQEAWGVAETLRQHPDTDRYIRTREFRSDEQPGSGKSVAHLLITIADVRLSVLNSGHVHLDNWADAVEAAERSVTEMTHFLDNHPVGPLPRRLAEEIVGPPGQWRPTEPAPGAGTTT
ncbi:MAG: hypothetical protein GEU83_18610 [Pseudonocardiaceae bacterium]|nr:hypothetical protein [Pseudonocardiaceae bacterium]